MTRVMRWLVLRWLDRRGVLVVDGKRFVEALGSVVYLAGNFRAFGLAVRAGVGKGRQVRWEEMEAMATEAELLLKRALDEGGYAVGDRRPC